MLVRRALGVRCAQPPSVRRPARPSVAVPARFPGVVGHPEKDPAKGGAASFVLLWKRQINQRRRSLLRAAIHWCFFKLQIDSTVGSSAHRSIGLSLTHPVGFASALCSAAGSLRGIRSAHPTRRLFASALRLRQVAAAGDRSRSSHNCLSRQHDQGCSSASSRRGHAPPPLLSGRLHLAFRRDRSPLRIGAKARRGDSLRSRLPAAQNFR